MMTRRTKHAVAAKTQTNQQTHATKPKIKKIAKREQSESPKTITTKEMHGTFSQYAPCKSNKDVLLGLSPARVRHKEEEEEEGVRAIRVGEMSVLSRNVDEATKAAQTLSHPRSRMIGGVVDWVILQQPRAVFLAIIVLVLVVCVAGLIAVGSVIIWRLSVVEPQNHQVRTRSVPHTSTVSMPINFTDTDGKKSWNTVEIAAASAMFSLALTILSLPLCVFFCAFVLSLQDKLTPDSAVTLCRAAMRTHFCIIVVRAVVVLASLISILEHGDAPWSVVMMGLFSDVISNFVGLVSAAVGFETGELHPAYSITVHAFCVLCAGVPSGMDLIRKDEKSVVAVGIVLLVLSLVSSVAITLSCFHWCCSRRCGPSPHPCTLSLNAAARFSSRVQDLCGTFWQVETALDAVGPIDLTKEEHGLVEEFERDTSFICDLAGSPLMFQVKLEGRQALPPLLHLKATDITTITIDHDDALDPKAEAAKSQNFLCVLVAVESAEACAVLSPDPHTLLHYCDLMPSALHRICIPTPTPFRAWCLAERAHHEMVCTYLCRRQTKKKTKKKKQKDPHGEVNRPEEEPL